MRFGIELVSEEKLEARVIHEGIDRGLNDGAGKNVYHGRHRFLCCDTQAHSGWFGATGEWCIFVQGYHAAACSIRQQLRFESMNDKKQRKRDRDGLGEQKPVFTHGMMNFVVSNGRRGFYAS